MNTSNQKQYESWQQWAATAADKKCTSNLLDDEETDESVEQHMQIPGMGPATDSPFMPPMGGLARGGKLVQTESGALPTVSLRRCNHS